MLHVATLSIDYVIESLKMAKEKGETDLVIQINTSLSNQPIIMRGKQEQTLIYQKLFESDVK